MVTELLNGAFSWPTLLLLFVVYGFMPGSLLRLIVLAYRRGDPRRDELVAELYAVPRISRPFWVLEQLETALFEAVWERLLWAATGRIIHRWHLGSGVRRNRDHPDTFHIPTEAEKATIKPGVTVKQMFDMSDFGERMWVDVVAVKRRHIVGRLVNTPVGIPRLDSGDMIKFKRKHIIDIMSDQASDGPDPLPHSCEERDPRALADPNAVGDVGTDG